LDVIVAAALEIGGDPECRHDLYRFSSVEDGLSRLFFEYFIFYEDLLLELMMTGFAFSAIK